MKHNDNNVEDITISYIGGGSRGWAWKLMADLAREKDISGEVRLYDIDRKAAQDNKIIGNRAGGNFRYTDSASLEEALTGADFVIISILPGTFDEMESDVHYPEKYGIYQSVGDTAGPGGIVRALRTIPMFVEIAQGIRACCPEAWVINYTNPMALCVRALYEAFPAIKAFGCCHEVFGTQNVLCRVVKEEGLAEQVERHELTINPVGVNHFTWITKAYYRDIDLFPVYQKYIERNAAGIQEGEANWMNRFFTSKELVKFDLFQKFGAIAAAGDRHLAEFCPGNWYLKEPETARRWGFDLTPVSWRKKDLEERLEKSAKLVSGEMKFEKEESGEEGVHQIKALLGLGNMVTNVNLPNRGQIPNLPIGTIVETNAIFSGDSVVPQMAGCIPAQILNLTMPAVCNQEVVLEAALKKDIDLALCAIMTDRLSDRLSGADAREMLLQMLRNTKESLPGWKIS